MSLRRAAAAVVLFAAATAAHAQFVINEGFNNVATLAGSGWILSNASAPLGTTPGWFQGDQTIFTVAGRRAAGVRRRELQQRRRGRHAGELADLADLLDAGCRRRELLCACRHGVGLQRPCSTWGFSKGGSSFADFALGSDARRSAPTGLRCTVSFAAQGAGCDRPVRDRLHRPGRPRQLRRRGHVRRGGSGARDLGAHARRPRRPGRAEASPRRSLLIHPFALVRHQRASARTSQPEE